MTRKSQAARWVAAVGLVFVSVLAATGALQSGGTKDGDGKAAAAARPATPSTANVALRSNQVRPMPLWWLGSVGGFVIVLFALLVEGTSVLGAVPRTAWAGRYDRGPPAGLTVP